LLDAHDVAGSRAALDGICCVADGSPFSTGDNKTPNAGIVAYAVPDALARSTAYVNPRIVKTQALSNKLGEKSFVGQCIFKEHSCSSYFAPISLNACCLSALSEGNMIIMVILDSSFWWRPGTPLEAEEHLHGLAVLSYQRQRQMWTDRVVITV
jgi:hypothetical protein